MSNFYARAIRPNSYTTDIDRKMIEEVEMIDDYYGTHQYGVRFPDGKVYKEEDCKIIKETK